MTGQEAKECSETLTAIAKEDIKQLGAVLVCQYILILAGEVARIASALEMTLAVRSTLKTKEEEKQMFFDPEQFMQTTVQGASSTEYVNIPEGEYIGMIRRDGVKAKKITARDSGDEFLVLELTWETDDPRAREATGRNNPSARQSIFLDLTPEGNLDMGKGKNVNLGRLREALKQNDPTRPWSFSMLSGQPARIEVKHKTESDGKVYANVVAVAAI